MSLQLHNFWRGAWPSRAHHGTGRVSPGRGGFPSLGVDQDPFEEVRQCLMSVQRKHVGDMLVGAHHDDTAGVPIDPAQVEDVLGRWIRAEHLLVIGDAEGALAWEQDCRQLVDLKFVVPLLEDRPDVDDRVGIGRPSGCSG